MPDTVQLTRHLSEALGRAVEIRAVEPLYGGACQDNFKISLGEGAPLVLRSDAPSSLPGSLGRSDEHDVILAARSRSVTTPDVMGLGVGLVHEGSAAYFMSWAEGVAIGRHVVRGAPLANAREGLAVELARQLTRIHSITPITHPSLFPGRDRTERTDPVLAQLSDLRRSIDTLPHRRPALEVAYAWLAANRPAAREVTLVHGDFRTGNFLVSPQGLSAVLDWEFAHFGSPHEDLAWIAVRDWRFGELHKPIGGFSEREPFYAAYEAESGRALDRVALHWWEVFGNARWGAGALHQGRRYSEQKDLELVAIARRAAEMEFEALRLIKKGELMIEPDQATLLEAVAHFLETDLKAAAGKDPALAFRTLIAAHLCRSAALESRHPVAAPSMTSDAALAARLLSGEEAPEKVLDGMLAALGQELAVVSPRFDLALDLP